MDKKMKIISISFFTVCVLLMTVPIALTYFTGMDSTLFKILNVIGILLSTIYITIATAFGAVTITAKVELNDFGLLNQRLSRILFFIVVIGQLVALMFVNIN